MRTTLTLDDDVATLLANENRRAHEPIKQTVNRLMRLGLAQAAIPSKRERYVVHPFDTGITSEQWLAWEGRKIDDILEEAERNDPS